MKINPNTPVPKLRNDLSVNVVKDNGQEIVILQDNERIAEHPFAVSVQMYYVLQVLDANLTWDDLRKSFNEQTGGNIEITEVLIQNIEQMYINNYLETPNYFKKKNEIIRKYHSLSERPPVCSGNSYSSNKQILEKELNEFFAAIDKSQIKSGARNIIVPHIDFKIGEEVHKTYAAGYHSMRDNDADLFVIFGTSHFALTDYIMLSEKNYATPLGVMQTDIDIINQIKLLYPDVTIDDLAHKNEHSIELQVVLLQHYFKDRNIKILPVLVSSFHDFFVNGEKPDTGIKKFMDALQESIEKSGKKAAFISSVDFGHIGKKFGDDYDAKEKLGELKVADKKLIDSLLINEYDAFFDKIKADNDKWKVCGTAPIYTMLNLHNGLSGELLNYGQWYEEPTKSAVSYASIAYYNK